MTNKLTQAELIDLAKQAGFNYSHHPGIALTDLSSLSKFAQLIQQRQGYEVTLYRESDDEAWMVCPAELVHIYKAQGKKWQFKTLYTAPPAASQLVAQALEKAAQLVDEAIASPNVSLLWVVDEIRALKDQPVEQGGDELVEALRVISGLTCRERSSKRLLLKIHHIANQALANRRGGE